MKTVIVVGNGMVGYKFCEKFIAQPSRSEYRLLVFGEEPRPAYDRVHLSAYFESKNAKALELAPADWYQGNGIELITGQRVTDIENGKKKSIRPQDKPIPTIIWYWQPARFLLSRQFAVWRRKAFLCTVPSRIWKI